MCVCVLAHALMHMCMYVCIVLVWVRLSECEVVGEGWCMYANVSVYMQVFSVRSVITTSSFFTVHIYEHFQK